MSNKYKKHVLKACKYFKLIRVNEKAPIDKNWYEKGTQDPNQIENYFNENSNQKFGILTGSANKILVIDIDVKNDKNGEESIKELEAKYEDLPKTIEQKTKNGGRHLIYKVPNSFKKTLVNSVSKLGNGIDVRAEKGQIVLYELKGRLAKAPNWLLDICTKQEYEQKEDKEYPKLQLKEIKKLLKGLDIKNYKNREDWFKIILAVKRATDSSEIGRKLALNWSLQDDSFDDTEIALNNIWNSADDIENKITVATLIDEHRKSNEVSFDDLEVDDSDISRVVNTKSVKPPNELLTKTSAAGAVKAESCTANVYKMLAYENYIYRKVKYKSPFFDKYIYNTLKCREVKNIKKNAKYEIYDEALEETDVTELEIKLHEHTHQMKVKSTDIRRVISLTSSKHKVNPVYNYLESLDEWDKTERLETWLIDIAGVKDSIYSRAVSKKFLISAVARGIKPGCKVDTMLVLEGEQGCGKSMMIETLAGEFNHNPRFEFNQSDSTIEQCIMGGWIIEIAEMLSAFTSKDINKLKDLISRSNTDVRFPYRADVQNVKRSCVMIGTLNPRIENNYLRDETGSRRFYPIRVRKNKDNRIDNAKLKEMRDQLFAEAYYRYKKGEIWYLVGEEEEQADEQRSKREVQNPYYVEIFDLMSIGEFKDCRFIQARDVALKLVGNGSDKLTTISRLAAKALIDMKWKRGRRSARGVQFWGFIRTERFDDLVKSQEKVEKQEGEDEA